MRFTIRAWPSTVSLDTCRKAYHALLESHQSATVWNGFGTFLQFEPEHFEEAENAFRRALALNSDNADTPTIWRIC